MIKWWGDVVEKNTPRVPKKKEEEKKKGGKKLLDLVCIYLLSCYCKLYIVIPRFF